MNRTHFITGALIVISAVFTASSDARTATDLEKLRQAAEQSGDLALSQFEIFHNTYLSDVTIQTPKISQRGSISGKSTFAGQQTRVLLQYIESNQGMGRWILAAKLPVEKLGDLAPAVHGSITDQLQLETPIIIFAKQPTRLDSRDLDPAVREFYGSVFGTDEFQLQIQDGINLLTAARVTADIQAGTQMLGLNLERLVLQGSILKNFDAEALKQAKRDGKLLKAMARDSELRALLTNLKITGLPKEFQIRDLALLVTGDPTVGLEFYMTVGSGSEQRDFRCRAKFLLANAQNQGRQGVSISATSDVDQPWQDALGIEGLDMRDIAMEIRYERANAASLPTVFIGVGGKMNFGGKFVEVVGGLQSKAGVLVGFFKGSINSINRDDLVAVVNDAHTRSHGGQGGALIDGRSLPDFEIRNATFNFAPMGGSEELGIESGIGMKGELILFGSSLGQADVLADANSQLLRIKAKVNRFRIAEIELHDTALDVLMTSGSDSHFRFKGGARVLDIEATAEADLSADKTFVSLAGKVANTFEADLVFRTPSLSNPVWEFEAGFKDDFSRKLGTQVAADIRSWAEKTKGDFDRAMADIDKAKREVDKINNEIARTQQQVNAERQQHQAALSRAQQDVQRINRSINDMRQQVQSERNRHLAAIQRAEADVRRLQTSIDARRSAVKDQRNRDLAVHKREMDTAKRNYDKAQSAFKSAERAWKKERNPIKKVKRGITKDAKGVARDAKKAIYVAAKKKYDLAKAALNRVPVDADPQIVALKGSQQAAQGALQRVRQTYQRVTGGVPVDADPRIAGLNASKQTALAALRAAQSAFDLAHRIPVDADPRVAGLFAARDTAQVALDVAKGAVSVSGDSIQLATRVLEAAASGKIISVQSARLSGKLAALEANGRVKLVVNVRVLDKPELIELSIATSDLQSGNVFTLAADNLLAAAQRGN